MRRIRSLVLSLVVVIAGCGGKDSIQDTHVTEPENHTPLAVAILDSNLESAIRAAIKKPVGA